ncbi:MAG: UPF0175 family protein [Candidatus Wallbacteria bacterium]|nr:UPF0175 family protein [Candidatus Wallbacteria bacterium]
MLNVTWNLPDELLLALGLTPDTAADELRLAAVVKFYELGRPSSGKAADLAGLPRVVFPARLADYGVPAFRLTEEEIRQDAENA